MIDRLFKLAAKHRKKVIAATIVLVIAAFRALSSL